MLDEMGRLLTAKSNKYCDCKNLLEVCQVSSYWKMTAGVVYSKLFDSITIASWLLQDKKEAYLENFLVRRVHQESNVGKTVVPSNAENCSRAVTVENEVMNGRIWWDWGW